MSIKTDQLVKEQGYLIRSLTDQVSALALRINALEQNIVEGDEVPRETVSADLVEQYQSKYGKPPHHRMKPETIREALR